MAESDRIARSLGRWFFRSKGLAARAILPAAACPIAQMRIRSGASHRCTLGLKFPLSSVKGDGRRDEQHSLLLSSIGHRLANACNCPVFLESAACRRNDSNVYTLLHSVETQPRWRPDRGSRYIIMDSCDVLFHSPSPLQLNPQLVT
jgi:hypothetical protein